MNVKALLLTIASSIVTLIALEGLLRISLDHEQLFSASRTQHEQKSWQNAVQFWQKHQEEPPNETNFDPVLGWDIERHGNRIRGSATIQISAPANVRRVVSVGDSFTFGLDVEEPENFTSILNECDAIQALNMGVPGYGIDQSFLKYREHGAKYQPDAVLFGIYVGDYERTRLSFNFGPKPVFQTFDGQLRLANSPVPRPSEEVARISQALNGRSFLKEIVVSSVNRIAQSDSDRLDYFNQTDDIIRALLERLQSDLSPNQQLVIIHIPHADAFSERNEFRDEASQRLRKIYEQLEINVIDLATEFRDPKSSKTAAQAYYHDRGNGSFGHLNPTGHERVAHLVLEALNAECHKTEGRNKVTDVTIAIKHSWRPT